MDRKLLALYFVALSLAFGGYSVLRFLDMRFYGDAPTLVTAICQYPKIKGLLNVHFSYALLIFRPLCWFLPCWAVVGVLAFLQGVGLAFAAVVLYKIVEEITGNSKAALLASLTFTLHPGMHGIVSFDLHPEAYALPFVALATYYLVVKDEPLKGYASAVVAMAFKETAAFPFMGLLLWRLTSGLARRWEKVLALLVFVGGPIAIIAINKLLHVKFLVGRWTLFIEKPNARFDFIKVQFLVVTLLSVFPALFPSKNVLLWLPDFLNLFFTTSWYHFKFWYGFQYPTFWIFEMFVAAALNASRFKGRALELMWAFELALVIALALVADPLAYYQTFYTYFLYYATGGKPSPIPIYPWMSLTTYRPINFNYLCPCFEGALKLYGVASKFLKPGEKVAVSDPLMSIFACRYKPIHMGFMAMKDWGWMAKLSPLTTVAFVSGWLKSRVLVDLYGSVRMLDVPKYIWERLGKGIMVKNAGYVYLLNTTELKEINREIKIKYLRSARSELISKGYGIGKLSGWLKNLAEMKYGLMSTDGRWLPTLYVDSYKYGIKERTKLKGYIYVGVNGTYAFYGSPTILKLVIDGKVLKPSEKVVVMQDFVHANYLGELELSEGWHEIEVEVNPGWLQLYWKTPYSCAPYPPSAARYRFK